MGKKVKKIAIKRGKNWLIVCAYAKTKFLFTTPN